MKFKVIVSGCIFATICVMACGKNQFQTRPQIKIKSINNNVVPAGGMLVIKIEYTDKEGDLGGDTLKSIRRRLNRRPLPSGGASADSLNNIIPKFPEKNKGEFDVKFDWANYLKQSDIENDTIIFKFLVKDRGGNVSDTITTEKIVILKQ